MNLFYIPRKNLRNSNMHRSRMKIQHQHLQVSRASKGSKRQREIGELSSLSSSSGSRCVPWLGQGLSMPSPNYPNCRSVYKYTALSRSPRSRSALVAEKYAQHGRHQHYRAHPRSKQKPGSTVILSKRPPVPTQTHDQQLNKVAASQRSTGPRSGVRIRQKSTQSHVNRGHHCPGTQQNDIINASAVTRKNKKTNKKHNPAVVGGGGSTIILHNIMVKRTEKEKFIRSGT